MSTISIVRTVANVNLSSADTGSYMFAHVTPRPSPSRSPITLDPMAMHVVDSRHAALLSTVTMRRGANGVSPQCWHVAVMAACDGCHGDGLSRDK